MRDYLKQVWAARYFWWNLAMSDLRSRWRRSFFGVLWSILQPLGLTALLALVFSRLFHADIGAYAPYILSGVIFWEFVGASLTNGALCFVQAEPYIKQCKHPLAIYPLRIVLGAMVVMMMGAVPLVIWALVTMPQNFGLCWIAVLSFVPLAALTAWPLSTLMAYTGVRFRDLPHAMGLILQALWFVSPVYFEESLFRRGGLGLLVDVNPIYHFLQLLRAPLLQGAWPTAANYAVVVLTLLLAMLLAALVGKNAEKKAIFYL